jgi:hypothetical protein
MDMRFVTVNDLSLKDLQAMAAGELEATVSDVDFLETLARHRCFVVVPWVVRANKRGGLTKIAKLTYDFDGEIDKPRALVETAQQLKKLREWEFGGRLGNLGPNSHE